MEVGKGIGGTKVMEKIQLKIVFKNHSKQFKKGLCQPSGNVESLLSESSQQFLHLALP